MPEQLSADGLCWVKETGGLVLNGPFLRMLPPEVPPIDLPGWRGVPLAMIEYRPGSAYRVQSTSSPVRDMIPAEMQACADWLTRQGLK